jgi:hypothetical protein
MSCDSIVLMPDDVAATTAAVAGARLCIVQSEKRVLAIASEDFGAADAATSAATAAFAALAKVTDEALPLKVKANADIIDRERNMSEMNGIVPKLKGNCQE